jgi:hypothetical protein
MRKPSLLADKLFAGRNESFYTTKKKEQTQPAKTGVCMHLQGRYLGNADLNATHVVPQTTLVLHAA